MLWWLAETTVVAAVLAVLVTLLCRALLPRPAVLHSLWLAVLLKLLAPPLIAWPWPLATSSMHDSKLLAAERRELPAEIPSAPTLDSSIVVLDVLPAAVETAPVDDPQVEVRIEPMPDTTPLARAIASAAVDQADPISPQFPAENVAATIIVAWIAGAAFMVLLQLVRIVRFQHQVARGTPASAELNSLVGELAVRLGMRPPAVRVVAGLASPLVWSLGRSRLLWPAALVGRLTVDSERAVIVHELAHLRRRDHWIGWLQLVGSCVWWWSPLFWIVRRRIDRAAELACDAWVIETLPGARSAYAQALVNVCELVSRATVPSPALGMGGARQEIERRLTMILRESVPSRAPVRALFGVILLAVIALPSFSDGQGVAPRAATPDPYVAQTAPPPAVPKADYNPELLGPLRHLAAQATPAVPKTAGDDREQRLRNLEKTLDVLLHEVRELRRSQGNVPRTVPSSTPIYEAVPYRADTPKPAQPGTNVPPASVVADAYPPIASGAAAQQLYLLRATYALSNDKADALAALLKGLNVPVVEIQVKSNTIIVTTTPHAQRIVGEFIGLLQGKKPALPTDKPATGEEVPSNYDDSGRRKVKPAEKPAPAKNVPG